LRWSLAQARAVRDQQGVAAELEAARAEALLAVRLAAGLANIATLQERLTERRQHMESLDQQLVEQEREVQCWRARLRVVGERQLKICPGCRKEVAMATTGQQHMLSCRELQVFLQQDQGVRRYCEFHVYHPQKQGREKQGVLLCRGGM
jgi:uncharacterized coiled-coil protein SlyX